MQQVCIQVNLVLQGVVINGINQLPSWEGIASTRLQIHCTGLYTFAIHQLKQRSWQLVLSYLHTIVLEVTYTFAFDLFS